MIHVLIERRIAEDMIATYDELAKRALHQSYIAEGFISGEAFTNAHALNERFLLCKWRSEQDWKQWAISPQRLELINQIAPLLEEPERITVLQN